MSAARLAARAAAAKAAARPRRRPAPGHAVLAAATACALAFAPVAASAHRPWLLASSTLVDGDAPVVTIDAAVSEDLFRFDAFALALDDLVVTAPDGSRVPTSGRTATRRRTTFDVALPKKGTYRVAGVTDTVAASWRANGETKRWRGAADAVDRAIPAGAQDVQVTHLLGRAETFVTNDRPGEVPATPAGPGLALQPLTSPTDLSTGDTTRFVLTLDGRPLAGADVTVIRGDNRARYKLGEIALKTGADGSFAVTWPEAGQWWLGVSHGGRPGEGGGPAGEGSGAAAQGGADGRAAAPARRESYSATFEVLPR